LTYWCCSGVMNRSVGLTIASQGATALRNDLGSSMNVRQNRKADAGRQGK
jgi:hypothetical protein